MLLRLGMCLEAISYIIAIIFVVGYVTSYWTCNEIFYKMDADYVKRVTNLPAYTICPIIKSSFIAKQLNRLGQPNDTNVIEFAKGLLKPNGRYCRNCDKPEIRSLFGDDFQALTDELTEPCENFLTGCTWNGEPFQCCRHFQRISSKSGSCYSLNSAHSREPGLSPRDMTTSFQKPEAILVLELSTSVRVHVHDNKNLDFPPVKMIKKGEKGEITYKFREWSEDPSAWTVPRLTRNCTLVGEENVIGFSVYSLSACRIRCEVVHQYENCGCKHHLLPGPLKDCDVEGLICLDGIREERDCGCLQECTKMDVTYVRYSVERSTGKTSKVVVTLSAPPTERIVLTARVTLLDIIVTLACVSRLFTNKSLYGMLRTGFLLPRSINATSLPAPSATSRSLPFSSSSRPIYRLNSGNYFSVR